MRSFRLCASSLLLLTCAYVPSPAAQAPTWTFGAFNTKVTQFSFRIAVGSPEDKAVNAIAASLTHMEARYTGKYGPEADSPTGISTHLSPEFSRSMQENFDTFGDLPTDQTEKLKKLEAIKTDLAIKDRFTSMLTGLATVEYPTTVSVHLSVEIAKTSSIKASSISVRITSCSAGKLIPGRIIGNGTGPFDTQSSPGCFFIQVQSDDKTVKTFEESIGWAGKTSENLELPLE